MNGMYLAGEWTHIFWAQDPRVKRLWFGFSKSYVS